MHYIPAIELDQCFSFSDKRQFCCSGHLTAPDMARELLDSNITKSFLKNPIALLCCLHDSIVLQHVV